MGDARTGQIKQKKKRSLREGKDMGDYVLTNISKRGIISCRFLSFFPISPEARQAAATAMRAPTLSLTHNGSSDPLINHDLDTGDRKRGDSEVSSMSLLLWFAYLRPHDRIDQTHCDQLMVT